MADIKERQFGIPATDSSQSQFNLLDRTYSEELPLPDSAAIDVINSAAQIEEDAINRAEAGVDSDAELEWERNLTQVGAVAKPKNSTLRDYKSVLRQGGGVRNVEFSPYDYAAFDHIIVEKSGVDDTDLPLHPAFNDSHPDYKSYAPLRRNLAILRNYLMVTKFPDGVYNYSDKEDRIGLVAIQDMADKLGRALAGNNGGDSLIERFGRSLWKIITFQSFDKPLENDFFDAANTPDIGAAVMYNYLLEVQKDNSVLDVLPINNPRKWGLAERSETPFSEENLSKYCNSCTMRDVVNSLATVTNNLRSPDMLRSKDKIVSVDVARHVLEKLWDKLEGRDDESIELKDPRQEVSRMLLKVARGFRSSMSGIAKNAPELLQNDKLIAATNALEQITYYARGDLANILSEEGKQKDAQELINYREQAINPRFKMAMLPLQELVGYLEDGLNEADRIEQSISRNSRNLEQSEEMVNAKITAINNPALLEAARRTNNSQSQQDNSKYR